jgi:AcrR family transcriptional regulator
MSRRAKGAEREAAVVTAAAELIAEQGLTELRVADVAERAGMSVGHVTYYFPSKTELLVRAIQQSEAEFQQEVLDALASMADPWSRFQLLVEMAAAAGPGDRSWLLWFEVWAQAATSAEVQAAQRQLDRWWRDTMRQVIDDGITQGAFTCDDPAQAVSHLTALTDGLSVRVALGGGMSRDELFALVFHVARTTLGVDRD